MRRGTRAALVIAALLVAAGCSDDGETRGGDSERGARNSTAEVEQFTGSLEAFYEVPDPLPPGEPGDVIRQMPVEAPAGEAGWRIMYHSTDAEGEDRAVTGLVFQPTSAPPDDGWPIVAWAHGTSGLASGCAPSRNGTAPPGFGVEGVHVATDYIGLGPVGELHPYLSSAAEGHAVIDGVAAARSMPDVHAGDRWVVAGVSQGGHAALVTGEMAAERRPDLNLVGTVAIAPGSQLAKSFGDDLQARAITAMVLFGAATEDPAIDPRTFLNPEVYEPAAEAIEHGCIAEITAAMVPLAARRDFYRTDPRSDPVGSAWIAVNDPGKVASSSPLLLVQGGQDPLVVPARTDALFAQLCGIGQVVERHDVATANHDTVTDQASSEIVAWLAARFDDDPTRNDC